MPHHRDDFILEGRMPTRIRVVTGNRCTSLWCRENKTGHQAMSEGTTSGDPSQGFLPCVASGESPFHPDLARATLLQVWVGGETNNDAHKNSWAFLGLEPKCNVSYCSFRLGFQNMFTPF